MQERGERYREHLAGVSEGVVGHVESMDLDEILSRSSQVEKIDTVARRTFGLDSRAAGAARSTKRTYWRTCDCPDQPKERIACPGMRKNWRAKSKRRAARSFHRVSSDLGRIKL